MLVGGGIICESVIFGNSTRTLPSSSVQSRPYIWLSWRSPITIQLTSAELFLSCASIVNILPSTVPQTAVQSLSFEVKH